MRKGSIELGENGVYRTNGTVQIEERGCKQNVARRKSREERMKEVGIKSMDNKKQEVEMEESRSGEFLGREDMDRVLKVTNPNSIPFINYSVLQN